MTSTQNRWTRPKSVPIPTVWREFVGLREMEDGKRPVFRIQDVPDDRHDEVIDFMTIHYIPEETLNVVLNFKDDPVSIKEQQELWREGLKHKVSVVAFLHEEGTQKPKIAGCNVTGVVYKTDTANITKYEGPCMRKIFQDMRIVEETVNVFDIYGVEEYMEALGLCVDPMYRGQGLGLELLKARFDVCRAVGLKVTKNIFTGDASQKLAHRVGMEVLAEVPYSTFKEEDGTPHYPNVTSYALKLMAKRIE